MKPTCPVCGKAFWCDYPNQWVFKRDKAFICSWSCLRKYDGKEATNMKTLTENEKRMAAQLALDGGDALKYLKECGCANPTTSWTTVRNWALKNMEPEKSALLPEKLGKERKTEPKVELVYDPSIAEEYRQEHPEEYERMKKETAQREAAEKLIWQTSAIRNDELGEFYYDKENRTIDWRHPFGEEISLPPEVWKKLAGKIPTILKILGVEV